MSFPDGQEDEEVEDGERAEGDDVDEDEVHPVDVDADVDGVGAQRRRHRPQHRPVLAQLVDAQELRAAHHSFVRPKCNEIHQLIATQS